MSAQTWVALGAAILAAVVAVTVPLVTFRMTLQLDRVRWVRDERAKLYVDLIAEAVAEYEPFRVKEVKRERMTELLSPPRGRAELGARVVIFASDRVRALWAKYDEAVTSRHSSQPLTDDQRQEAQDVLYERFAALESRVRTVLASGELSV